MKALVRLLIAYFTGTPLAAWTSAITVVVLVPLTATIFTAPHAVNAPYEERLPTTGILVVFFGVCIGYAGAFLASAPLPVIAWRFAAGHRLHLLPGGYGKVLGSALLTAALVSVPGAVVTMGAYSMVPGAPLATIFFKAMTTLFFTFTVLYAVLWLIAERRSALALWVGCLLLIAGLAVPSFYISHPGVPAWGAAVASTVLWVLLAAGLAYARRLAAASGALLASVRAGEDVRRTAKLAGREVELMLGTARPWSIAIGQTVLMLFATLFISSPAVWLFFLTLFSAVFGAGASLAPAQSRALWLRAGWSRPELFGRVEAAHWRQNGYSLAVLLVLFAAGGWMLGLSRATLVAGVPLLVLATAVSTYLGLMMTKGVSWLEAALGVATMLLLMSVAVYGARDPLQADLVVGLELTLAVMALAFRSAAQRRWAGLDWLLCRRELAFRPPG